MKREDWSARYVLGLFRRHRENPIIQTLVRFLASDPWFVRAVCPGSDAIRINEVFVYPLAMSALTSLRGAVRWPPPPMNDDSIERISGVPQLGRALDHAGVCKRDEDGLYDLTPIDRILPFNTPRRERRRKEGRYRKMGLSSPEGGPAVPATYWKLKETL